MKVLHTIPGLSKKLGGPTTCTYQLVHGLNDSGCETELLSVQSRNPNEDLFRDPFIHYVKNDLIPPLGMSHNFNDFLKRNGDSYDIVHGNTIWLWPTHQSISYAHKNSKPFVLTTHGMLYPTALKVSAWKKKIALPLFQKRDLIRSDMIHATSLAELGHIRNFGLNNPVAVIPNCLKIETIPVIRDKENDIRVFGFVGRINRFKNIDLLLKAWASLGNKTCDSELLIIGSGDKEYEMELRRFVKEKSLYNVKFIGLLSGKDLSNAVSGLDYQLLVSRSENFGMVVPEALLQGVPVIATKGTPWPELLEERCGWWIDASVEGICESISSAIDLSENERRLMGKRGHDFVLRKFRSETIAQQMIGAYQWLLSGNDKPEYIYV